MKHNANSSLQSRDVTFSLHPFTNPRLHEEIGPMVIERGEGIYVFDNAGNRYLDSVAVLSCVSLGWGEERLIEAASKQMRKLAYYHSFNHRANRPAIDLAEKLVSITPETLTKAYFASSGSEANDTAVKLIWYYNAARGEPQKRKIITHIKGYHGTTTVTASMTGIPSAHNGFGLPLPGFLHVETPHYYHGGKEGESEQDFASRLARQIDELIEKEGPETVAAFFAEPAIAAGGMIVPPDTYFEKVQKVLKKHDVLMVADEVICGFGRTGKLFGSETFGITPDAMILAKQLSSAYLPISSVLISDEIFEGLKTGSDQFGVLGTGFTSSAHPVAAAVALETINIYEERDLISHAARTGDYMQHRLAELASHPLVGEVRGVGMLAGIELVKEKSSPRHKNFQPSSMVGHVCSEFGLKHGLIVRPSADDRMAITPQLITTEAQIDEIYDKFKASLDDTNEWVKETLPD